MKRKLLILTLCLCCILGCLLMTSCDFSTITDMLNGGQKTESDETVPTIIALKLVKDDKSYKEKNNIVYNGSNEQTFNAQGTNPMALTFSEKYYLIIVYDNPAELSVSKVKVNGVTYGVAQFADGSDENATYLEFNTQESEVASELTYTVNSVFYINGSSTSKMSWDPDLEHFVTAAVRPNYSLTLNYMNADYRLGEEKEAEVVTKENVYYATQMLNYIVDADYTGGTNVPTKTGGWVFAGWFTQPNGEGIAVSSDDFYFFWCDITLYAYYERMYEIDIQSLETPIEHTYSDGGRDKTVTFTSGAVLQNRDYATNELTHNVHLEIPDTVADEKITYTTQKRTTDGIPEYNVITTISEYPVVRLDKNVFDAFNTITDATIGKYVEQIDYAAFRRCTKMATCTFNEGSCLKYIGDFAFQETSALGADAPFTLPSTVEYLGVCGFRYSGWARVRNSNTSAAGESILYIPTTWKYIGYKCFADTNFERVVFRAGCYFEDQVTKEEGEDIESKNGSKEIRYGENSIGASLFSQCYRLSSVVFENSDGQSDALNIIPDLCFDAGSWWNNPDKKKGEFACISYIYFGEGIKEIGFGAFNYQVEIPELALPKSLEKVGRKAFYNCVGVTNLNFEHVTNDTINKIGINKALTKESQLKYLKSNCFGNINQIDSVYITSSQFAYYGNGVFEGCDHLKCIIFNNLQDIIPTGYKSSNAKFGYDPKVDLIDDDEVLPGHQQSDLLYATAESGEKEQSEQDDEFAITYASPIRVFCAEEYTLRLKEDLLIGKEVSVGNQSSGTKSFNDQVFVHPLEYLIEYTYSVDGKSYTVNVAVQEIYKANNGKPSTSQIGYSLVYWSTRNEHIILPTASDLNLNSGEIKEVAAYALPTSCTSVYIPSSYIRLEHDAFNGCNRLRTVEFEDVNTLTYIGQYAFFGTQITGFTAGTGLKAIGSYAFKQCTSLQWVDLRNSPMTNAFNGRMTDYYQYKYEYELEDYDEDFLDCLGNSAFASCSALKWIYLPKNIKQIRTGTFNGCESLVTVIIPAEKVNDSTKGTDDDCFYEYGQPDTVYQPKYMHQITIYGHSNAMEAHRIILPEDRISRYELLDSAPAHP